MTALWYFIISCLDTLPYVTLIFLPFKSALRIGYKKLVTLVSCVFTAGAGLYALAKATPSFPQEYHTLIRLIPIILFILFSQVLVKGRIYRRLFWAGNILPLIFIIITLSSYISRHTAYLVPLDETALEALWRLVITTVILLSTHRFYKKLALYTAALDDPKLWSHVFGVPLLLTVFMATLIPANLKTGNFDLRELIAGIAVHGIILLFSRLFFFVTEYEKHKTEAIEAKSHAEQLIELQKQQYLELADQLEVTRKTRHDMRHHLRTMKSMCASGDYGRLEEYINDISQTVEAPSYIKVCSNHAANALLSHYIERARAKGIALKIRLFIDDNICIKDADLCVLLGNAVENAFEACMEIPEHERFVHIVSSENAGRLYIVFGNSFDGKIDERDGKYYSRKRNYVSSGVGIDSIRAIAQKYGGSVRIDIEDKVFKLSVMLSLTSNG